MGKYVAIIYHVRPDGAIHLHWFKGLSEEARDASALFEDIDFMLPQVEARNPKAVIQSIVLQEVTR
jgi:hypothetical protein